MSDLQLRAAQRQVEQLPEGLERYRAQLLRSCSFRECWFCQVFVPEELMPEHEKECKASTAASYDRRATPQTVSTFSAFGEFRPAEGDSPGRQSPAPAIRLPAPAIRARPRRESLYDTVSFASARPRKAIFYARGTLAGSSCMFLQHTDSSLTNIPGRFGVFPADHFFYWYRLTLVPDAGQDSEDLLRVWQHGRLSFIYQQAEHLEWPCMAVMADPKELPRSQNGDLIGLDRVRSRADLTVMVGGLRQPFQIQPQTAIDFRLTAERAPAASLNFTVLMYGLHLMPIAGT